VRESEQLNKMRTLLGVIAPYHDHLRSCCSNNSFGDPSSDYCDCGLAKAKQAYDELYKLTRAICAE
jgi:hypothetical protein